MSHVQEIILRNKVDRRDALPSLMKVIKREIETQTESQAVMEHYTQTGLLSGRDKGTQTHPAGLLCTFEAGTQTGLLSEVDGCFQTHPGITKILVLRQMSDGQCVKKDTNKEPPVKDKNFINIE